MLESKISNFFDVSLKDEFLFKLQKLDLCSSDLQRAYKTCHLILEENQKSNLSLENIKQDKLLREKNFGIHEG